MFTLPASKERLRSLAEQLEKSIPQHAKFIACTSCAATGVEDLGARFCRFYMPRLSVWGTTACGLKQAIGKLRRCAYTSPMAFHELSRSASTFRIPRAFVMNFLFKGAPPLRPDKQLQRTVTDKVPKHIAQRAAAELRH